MAIFSQIRGNEHPLLFRHRISHYIVMKALAITGLSALLVITVTTAILAVEDKPFINVLYEATSAFGTVGLSTGITPTLHPISKMLLILTMFLGRVGPLSFAVALTLRGNRGHQDIIYPEGKIVVG